MTTKQQIEADFEEFLVEIPMLLVDLKQLLFNSKKFAGSSFKYDLQTADNIEQFFLDVLNKKEKIPYSIDTLHRITAAYIGEYIIEKIGGQWTAATHPKDINYGQPVVLGFKYDVDDVGFAPFGVLRKFISSKEKGFFRRTLKFVLNVKKGMEDLEEEMKALLKKK